MSDALAITNLLYRYAECIDTGNLMAAAALFEHADVKASNTGVSLSRSQLLALWQTLIILHPDGTPRTKHVITNPIIEIEGDRAATCRSYYTVIQAVSGFPLQIIAAGRYHDWFERVEGVWRFSFRDYTLLDMKGDLSRHVTNTGIGAD